MNERFKNPAFWIGIVGVALSPVLSYYGMGYEDLVSWDGLFGVIVNFINNPYLVGSVVLALAGAFGVVVDSSTPGIFDHKEEGKAEDEEHVA